MKFDFLSQIVGISIISELTIHLLSSEKYQSYVRLICGMFMVFVCVSPLLNLLSDKTDFSSVINSFEDLMDLEELRREIKFNSNDLSEEYINQYELKNEKLIAEYVESKGLKAENIVFELCRNSSTGEMYVKIQLKLSECDYSIRQEIQDRLAEVYETNKGNIIIYQ